MSLSPVRQALSSIKRGANPLEEAQDVLQEYSYGPPQAGSYPAYPGGAYPPEMMQRALPVANALAIGSGVGHMVKRLSGVPASAYAARGIQGLLGNVIALSSNMMAKTGTNLISSALGGPYSKDWTGKGSRGSIKVTMNVPGNITMKQGLASGKKGTEGGSGGSGGGVTYSAIQRPSMPNVNVSNIFWKESPGGGAEIEMYRVDPITGEQRGAPVKQFTINLQGQNPTKVRDIENNLVAQLTGLAQNLIGGKPLKLPKPQIVRRRRGF